MSKTFFSKIASKVRGGFLKFYKRPQIYKFKYFVTLTNKSVEPKNIYLILPVPIETELQRLKSVVTIHPGSAGIFEDALYKNKYTFWQIDLAVGESQRFNEQFIVEVAPFVFKKTKIDYTLPYYADSDQALYKVYTEPNSFVSGMDEEIRKLAFEIRGDEKNVLKLAEKIYDFVMTYLEWKNPILDLYSYQQALELREVDCGGFGTFFVSLCQALGIPARLVTGFFAGYGKSSMHVWCEFMLPNGHWIPVDPSTEQLFNAKRTSKSGYFGFVGSDRVTFSYGCDIPLLVDGQKMQAPILQNPMILPGFRPEDIQMEIKCVTENVHE